MKVRTKNQLWLPYVTIADPSWNTDQGVYEISEFEVMNNIWA